MKPCRRVSGIKLNRSNTMELVSVAQLDEINGGMNVEEVATGLGMAGMGQLALAALPEAAFIGGAYVVTLSGSALVGTASGMLIGNVA